MRLVPLTLAAWIATAPTPLAQEALGTASTPRSLGAFQRGLGVPGPGLSGRVETWAVFDDGHGPEVYAAGWFYAADDRVVNGIARWNGAAWEPVGAGIGLSFAQEIRAMAVFDDGSGGEALYVAGQFNLLDGQSASGFGRWDGTRWEVLPGVFGTGFHALHVANDPVHGPTLFAGGEFQTFLGGQFVYNVLAWNGTGWRSLDRGIQLAAVHSLAAFDDGNGWDLYAGTEYVANRQSLRRWDGTNWTSIPSSPVSRIDDLQVHDDGSGERLYAALGQVSTDPVRAWDGSAWSAIGSLSAQAYDLDLLPGPAGDLLVASGSLLQNGISLANLGVWDGSSWLPLGPNAALNRPVDAMAVLEISGSTKLFAAGAFTQAGSTQVAGAASWDGSSWSVLASEQHGLDGPLFAFETYDDGNGPAVYASGSMRTSGLAPGAGVVRWKDGAWEEVGGGFVLGSTAPQINDLKSFPSGDGNVLVAGGSFQQAGTTSALGVVRWNGSSWAPMDSGLWGTVEAFEIYPFGGAAGGQPLLFACGRSLIVPGTFSSRSVCAWNGVTQEWSGVPGAFANNAAIAVDTYVLERHDDGSQDLLWVGGRFDTVDGQVANGIASWNGNSWSPSPFGGVTSATAFAAEVHELLSIDLPSLGGPALIVRGRFDAAGTIPAPGIALLTPTGWSAPANFARPTLETLAVFDTGSGPRLFAHDTTLGLVRWSGSTWISLGSPLPGLRPNTSGGPAVVALLGFTDDDGQRTLFLGGWFDRVGSRVSRHVAHWSLGGLSLPPLKTR